MNPDPNWLLSTIVQSTAAFVAIVAGFIISRLLALSAERSGLQTKAREIELQLALKNQYLEGLNKRLLDWDAEDFLEDSDVLDRIIESEGEISLTDVMNQVTGYSRNEDEIQPYWDEAITVTKNAFSIIREKFSELLEGSEDLDVSLKNLGIDLSSYRSKIYSRVFGDMLGEYEKRRNPFGTTMGSLAMSGISDIRTADEINRYGMLKRDIETLERDRNSMEAQLTDLKNQLTHLGQPKGVTLGIIFLAYFSLTGIVVPVFLLPFPLDQFTPAYKWIVFLLFFSGLLFFFIYLFILIRQLAEKTNSGNSA